MTHRKTSKAISPQGNNSDESSWCSGSDSADDQVEEDDEANKEEGKSEDEDPSVQNATVSNLTVTTQFELSGASHVMAADKTPTS